MSDSCCGGCGGQAHKPKEEQPTVQEYKPDQAPKQEQAQKQAK